MKKRLADIRWEDFQKLTPEEKAPYFFDGHDDIYHVIIAEQFNRKFLDELGALATKIRFIAKTEEGLLFLSRLLAGKRAMLYFSQPSTRTFLSFCSACQILGINIGEVRDVSTSSEFKGESREDSVRTFSSYYDLIIMRSEIGGLAERMAWVLSNTERPVPIINAGSGQDQHPTQALLDIYTLQRSFERRGGIDGKKIAYVGDLARGRTVRSLAILLTNYNNVEHYFVAPPQFQIKDDILQKLSQHGAKYFITSDFKSVIGEVDAIYMTRVQDEWDAGRPDSPKLDVSAYSITGEHLRMMKPDAVIMHPFPRRKEISPEVDRDPRAVYWRQMRNGMWIRVALIARIYGKDKIITESKG
jgi:aspartate carbamoyltransferase catalytic subunit